MSFIPSGDVAFKMLYHNTFEKKYAIYYSKQGKYNTDGSPPDINYFVARWINDSASPTCFPPQPGTAREKYIEYIKNNWCISVEQIDESELTKYWTLTTEKVFEKSILNMKIHAVDFYVSNRITGQHIFRLRDVYVDRGWITSINFISGEKSRRSGTKYTYTHEGKYFRFPEEHILKILDSNEDLRL